MADPKTTDPRLELKHGKDPSASVHTDFSAVPLGWPAPGQLVLERPATGPIAEAWIVSDEQKSPSRVAGGPLAGLTLADLVHRFGSRLTGNARCPGGHFPLLLKFLDARETLSVQVHPTDEQAERLRPGTLGKTEAWVILDAEPGSKLYFGLQPGTDRNALKRAIRDEQTPEVMQTIEPRRGDVIFVPAGTVHAIGAGLMLFEIQQTSDNTFRLHDWGRGRPVHIDEALASTDFAAADAGVIAPVLEAESPRREKLIDCQYFRLWRIKSDHAFSVGAAGQCRIAVVIEGRGELVANSASVPIQPGSAVLIPAEFGQIECRPNESITLLECGWPK